MKNIPYISEQDVQGLLNWDGVCRALHEAHQLQRARIADTLIAEGDNSLLNRSAWIRGLGPGAKTACIFPGNALLQPAVPTVHAVFTLFDEHTGAPFALIDAGMLTRWKTAGDSVLAARYLSPANSRRLLIIGAGVVARSLVDAYTTMFPQLDRISIWNHRHQRAVELADCLQDRQIDVRAVSDLPEAAYGADIISSAVISQQPVLKGQWVSESTHVDLIGAYRKDMREADDELISKAELFVDSRETALHDTGELGIPLATGVITEKDIRADLYDLCRETTGRSSNDAITLFKNGGGAHLDLMTAHYIYRCWRASRSD